MNDNADMLRNGEQVFFNIDVDEDEGLANNDAEQEVPVEGNLFPVPLVMHGHTIFFPGGPNSRQNQILSDCLSNLQEGRNILLECPSDKERSISLLAVLFAYQQRIVSNGGVDMQQVPGSSSNPTFSSPCKIYYACKSIEEINKVIKCLNNFKYTKYLENLSMAVLAHPTQLCASCDDDVIPCSFPANTQSYKFIGTNGGTIVHDIKHIKSKGESDKFCPYKYNMEIHNQSALVFCTQDFLLSQNLRRTCQINLENAIVILDDGGNVEIACYKEASVSVPTKNLKSAGEFLESIAKALREVNQNRHYDEVREGASLLSALAECLCAVSYEINVHSRGSASPDSQRLLEILKENRFDQEYVTDFNENLSQTLKIIQADDDLRHIVKNDWRLKFIPVVQKFLTSLQYMHNSISNGMMTDFAMQINKYVPAGADPANTFELAFVNASTVIAPFENSTVIISSACLPAVSILRQELSPSLTFDQDSDVLISSQDHTKCFFGYASFGPHQVPLELSWENRDRITIHEETGEAILSIALTIPNGIVVSFPSIAALRSKVESWKNGENRPFSFHSIWDDLKGVKHVFCELDFMKADDAKRQLEKFRILSKSPHGNRTGAIMLALHRERVSELMNFEPGEVRAFVSLGIPYHSIKAFHITTKESFIHSQQRGEVAEKRNNLWYNAEAFNNQNQKFAHCIRKEQDWVVGLVLDDRMERKVKGGVTEILNPRYMEREWKGYPNVGKLVIALDKFIHDCDVSQ